MLVARTTEIRSFTPRPSTRHQVDLNTRAMNTSLLCSRLYLILGLQLLLLAWHGSAHADPIKLQPIQVTASNTYSGSSPANAVDSNSATIWNAGAGPSQWIQLDLGRTVAVRKVRLRVAQTPAGTTTHVISVGQDSGARLLLRLFRASPLTVNGLNIRLARKISATCATFESRRLKARKVPKLSRVRPNGFTRLRGRLRRLSVG